MKASRGFLSGLFCRSTSHRSRKVSGPDDPSTKGLDLRGKGVCGCRPSARVQIHTRARRRTCTDVHTPGDTWTGRSVGPLYRPTPWSVPLRSSRCKDTPPTPGERWWTRDYVFDRVRTPQSGSHPSRSDEDCRRVGGRETLTTVENVSVLRFFLSGSSSEVIL